MSSARKRFAPPERHDRILRDLRLHSVIRVSHLARALGVTTETVRRDLDELAAAGRLNRTYGGAAQLPTRREPTFHERQHRQVDERSRIGARAAALIRRGEVLMIDCGSTTLHFARHLASMSGDITVVTNSPAVAATLGVNGSIQVLLCPGEYDSREGGVFGSHTSEFLQRLRADRVVFGASGLGDDGPTEAIPAAAAIKRTMIACAKQALLLVDASKYGQEHIELVCPLVDIGDLVVDRKPPATLAAALREAGVRLHIAPSL